MLIIMFRTAIGLRTKDGIVLAVEKLVHSKLLVPDSNRRIQTIDRSVGMVRLVKYTLCVGFVADCFIHDIGYFRPSSRWSSNS